MLPVQRPKVTAVDGQMQVFCRPFSRGLVA